MFDSCPAPATGRAPRPACACSGSTSIRRRWSPRAKPQIVRIASITARADVAPRRRQSRIRKMDDNTQPYHAHIYYQAETRYIAEQVRQQLGNMMASGEI